jgi:photosystem II stability/assembly factor-like uncharacterized protein
MSLYELAPDLLNAMTFRCIGPPRGGRVVAVAGDPSDQATFYFGGVAGGVWKTTDAGVTWQCISDGFFKTASVGALEVAPSHPNIIYAGMGESTIRTDVSYGDGVYKSTDAGRTWKHCGLTDTRHIGKIRIHPQDPNRVYVAALGHAFGENDERGLFRTKDGGATWERVLFKSRRAGAVDVTLDEHNPDILYASVWQVRRTFWKLDNGGDDSGLWKSSDGGDTWNDISQAKGLPKGPFGKIGVAASPVQAGRVWALVEAKADAGLYRSDDFGETWTKTCEAPELRRRPWYYLHVIADTQDPDTVYVCNLDFHKSIDAGKTFTAIPTPHGDNHALWIDPKNNRRMIEGNDGGACISFDGGASFSTVYNQNTAQFYHLDVDDQFPYVVYGTQQDNSSIAVPSDALSGAIGWGDCFAAGTGESGYIAVKPDDPKVVYVGAVGSSPGGLGSLQRCDLRTGQIQLVNVWPQNYGGAIAPKTFKYRFPWTYPILFSPHDPNVLYAAGNMAFRSIDEGHSWQAISPDLTRNDPAKQEPSGGDITLDNSAAEIYCTISSLRESAHEPGVFWAGSDDGLVHISRDGGASWQNVTPPGLPEWTWVRVLEPSPHDPATCYMAATRYKLDDNTPYLYKTNDYGATWTRISEGIPADDYTRVIRADPNCAGILYCGTETGLYVSLDDGASWRRWQSNLPVAPIFDLKVKGTDLVIATHGRSFWVLDDLTPLHQAKASAGQTGQAVTLVAPRTTMRVLPDLYSDWLPTEGRVYTVGVGNTATYIAKRTETGHIQRTYLDAGQGAPRGAVILYHLSNELPAGAKASLEFLDQSGAVVRAYKPKPDGWDNWDEKQKSMDGGPWMATKKGFNRFLWNLRCEGATRIPGNKTAGEALEGPFVLPGPYTVRLTIGDQVQEANFQVANDPRVTTPYAHLEEQHALLLRIRDGISATHRGVLRLREVRDQVQAWQKRLADHAEIKAAAQEIIDRLNAVEDALIIPGEQKETYHLIVSPRLNEALSSLIPVVGTADARPTTQAAALVEEYIGQVDAQLAIIEETAHNQVAALNQMILAAGAPPIMA